MGVDSDSLVNHMKKLQMKIGAKRTPTSSGVMTPEVRMCLADKNKYVLLRCMCIKMMSSLYFL